VKRSTQPSRRPQAAPSPFRLSPVAAGALGMLMAMGAQAQQTPGPATQPAAAADATQTITVTGIRRGIENAINVKKNADGIVEAVSAEDIGKLPDISIAESIARLPGLSAQRVAGRAQVISVRGLSPDFATSLLNGRELVSTGDNRSVEFDQYPSELLSGVTVYKTPDAGLIGQGLSGTLDMQTVRPLNFGNRVISFNVRGSRNSLGSAANASANGNRFSVSYIDQFADRTVGIALGFAHLDTPVQENQVGLYEPWEVKGQSNGVPIAPGLAPNTFSTGGIKALRRTGESKRDGLMAAIEFRPSKEWTSVLDLFHSKAKQEDTANQFEMNLNYNGTFPCETAGPPATPPCTWSNTTVNGNNTLTGGTIVNTYPLVRGIYNKRDDKISAIGWNNKFKFGSVGLNADVSYSKANRDELSLENNTQLLPPAFDTATLQFRQNDFSQIGVSRDYSNPATLFLRNTIYGSGYGKVPKVEDELSGFKLTGTLPAPAAVGGFFSDIELGINYADREKTKRQPEGSIRFDASAGPNPTAAIGSDLQYGLVNLGFAGLGSIPSWNVPGAVGRYQVFTPTDTEGFLIAKAWNVTEKTTTAYAKANIDADLGGNNMRGNFGLQLQRTDQSSAANYFDGSAPEGSRVKPISGGKTYTDVLPSLNLAFALGGDQTVRVAAARQVARPRVDQLRASVDFGIDSGTGKPGASGGNPLLDPWRANAFDISYEKYFATKAYFAAAAFYKDLKSYIYTQSRDNYDFSSFVEGYTPPPGSPPAQLLGTFTAPQNGQGGKVQGIELSASVPFELLTPALKGFGIVASASFNNSNIKVRDPESASSVGGGDINLPGLSKSVYNLTAYYERGGFEARISQRKRSDFIGEIGNFAGNRTLRYVVGESVIDAQIGYTFNEGALKGLGLLFQVNNLNDSANQTYAGSKDRPLEYIKWGRSYLFGANYKF
jgi:iron complex outermembrane recepter protein